MGSLLSSKVRLFRVAGIDVHLHSLFILFAAAQVFRGFESNDPGWTFIWLFSLWLGVLLHEFGHCWGARAVGGDAQEVILWPLGGLALVEAPMTPWAQFVTTACGPAVNLVLAGLGVLVGSVFLHLNAVDLLLGREWHSVVGTFTQTNALLFAFNLIPAFPLDTGRLLQIALWTRIGYQRATRIAVYVSFVCTAGLVLAAVFRAEPLLAILGVWVFSEAYQTLRMLQAGMFAELDEPWRQTFQIREPRPREPGPVARWLAQRREAREKARVAAEEARALRLDDVLRRVAEVGMDGLSREERAFLDLESARLRNQRRDG